MTFPVSNHYFPSGTLVIAVVFFSSLGHFKMFDDDDDDDDDDDKTVDL